MKLCSYVLTKNEAPNIRACLAGLANLQAPIRVLDSGSTDETVRIAGTFRDVTVSSYPYVDHATAYNDICENRAGMRAEYAVVVDADMVVMPALAAEVLDLVRNGRSEVIAAPILMYWNGKPLRRGSLCPPKAIVFRTGTRYFVPRGHGEALRRDVHRILTHAQLIHDDHKPYRAYLESQARYADALAARVHEGDVSWRDRVRSLSPLMMLAVPVASYVARGGFLSGRTGLMYAVDRLIAEAIVYRRVLARAQERESASPPPRPCDRGYRKPITVVLWRRFQIARLHDSPGVASL